MRQSLLPVVLLMTVALTTSNILPILSIKELEQDTDNLEDQVIDNTFSDKGHKNDIRNNIFYKVSIAPSGNAYTPLLIPKRSSHIVYVSDNNWDEDMSQERIIKRDKYDDKGFRKEQWHNYPRQLDRLQKYLYQHHQFDTNLNPDPDDPEDTKEKIYEAVTNDIHEPNNKNGHNNLDAAEAATSPLLILKIRLAYLKNDLQSADSNEYADTVPVELSPNSVVDEEDEDEMDPIISAVKVKREGISSTKRSDYSEKTTDDKKTIKKRIFSLWSRLQSLSHKGHELHHRRHLHAFYGFPDSDGSGTLTAETRASFIRPPGSPLRWG